jgi:hypothetical protein
MPDRQSGGGEFPEDDSGTSRHKDLIARAANPSNGILSLFVCVALEERFMVTKIYCDPMKLSSGRRVQDLESKTLCR